MSKPLTDAETRYWPTDLEMSGLVWAAKRRHPYMQRAFVTFVTDHHSNVALCKMQSIDTTSADRSSLRLHRWAIYLDQYRDHMRVIYSKGADLECPDALSRLRYDMSSEAKHLRSWAARLGIQSEREEFDLQECFAVTRLGRARASPVADTPAPVDTTARNETAGMTVKLVPVYANKLRLATQNSQCMRAIHQEKKICVQSVRMHQTVETLWTQPR